MGRRKTKYNDYRGELLTYDGNGNIKKSTPFSFDIEASNITTIDPLSGQPIKKGEFRIVTDSDIEPKTNVDKVQTEFRDQPYIVGEQSNRPKENTTGRRGRLELTRKFYLK